MEHNPEAFAEVSIEDFMGLSIKDVRSNLAIFNFFLSHPTKLENKCLGSRHKMRNWKVTELRKFSKFGGGGIFDLARFTSPILF